MKYESINLRYTMINLCYWHSIIHLVTHNMTICPSDMNSSSSSGNADLVPRVRAPGSARDLASSVGFEEGSCHAVTHTKTLAIALTSYVTLPCMLPLVVFKFSEEVECCDRIFPVLGCVENQIRVG